LLTYLEWRKITLLTHRKKRRNLRDAIEERPEILLTAERSLLGGLRRLTACYLSALPRADARVARSPHSFSRSTLDLPSQTAWHRGALEPGRMLAEGTVPRRCQRAFLHCRKWRSPTESCAFVAGHQCFLPCGLPRSPFPFLPQISTLEVWGISTWCSGPLRCLLSPSGPPPLTPRSG
jgi:hypothetical protein